MMAYWTTSGIEYSLDSGIIVGYSGTLESPWDSDFSYGLYEEFDEWTERWYCAEWHAFYLWVSLAAYVQVPSGATISLGADSSWVPANSLAQPTPIEWEKPALLAHGSTQYASEAITVPISSKNQRELCVSVRLDYSELETQNSKLRLWPLQRGQNSRFAGHKRL